MNGQILPMFPLPDFFVLPRTIVPLHIFEERYRQMVGDLLDNAGRLVMASLPKHLTGRGLANPPVFPYGALTEIIHHQKAEDGRYLILLLGLARVRLEEVPSDRLYRQARIEQIATIPCPEQDARRLRPLLAAAIDERTLQDVELAKTSKIDALTDILLQCLKLSPAQLQEVFAEPDECRRAERALAWHGIST